MGNQRDFGTCCALLPLKFGVGLITMYLFIHSIICIIALTTQDIRFQANGYSERFFWVPSCVGAFGLVFGFIGLLGVYDDKMSWVRALNLFFLTKLVGMLMAMIADYWNLRLCGQGPSSIPAIQALAAAGVCSQARSSYLFGCIVDYGVNLYFYYCCWDYQKQLESNPPFGIEFGHEKYDVSGRWKMYKVKDPRRWENQEVQGPPEVEDPEAHRWTPMNMLHSYGAVHGDPSRPPTDPQLAPSQGGAAWHQDPNFVEAGANDPRMWEQTPPNSQTAAPPARRGWFST